MKTRLMGFQSKNKIIYNLFKHCKRKYKNLSKSLSPQVILKKNASKLKYKIYKLQIPL